MTEFKLDGDVIVDEDTFYDEISKVCGFPDYFGRNLDALNDCLTDLAVEQPGSTIWWLNVHPYLRNNRPIGNPPMDLLDHMRDICNGKGLIFRA